MFGVMVYRNDGTYLYGTNSANDRVPLPPLERDGAMRFRLRDLKLLDGSYRLTVIVFADQREGTPPADYHEQRYGFKVRSGTLEQGFVRLDHEWRLVEPEVPRPATPVKGSRRGSR